MQNESDGNITKTITELEETCSMIPGTMMDAQGVFAQEDSRVDIGSRARRSPAPKISAPIDAQMDTMMMTILRNALVQVQMDQHLLDLGDDDPQARALSVSPAAQGSNFGVGRFRSANKRPQNSLPRAQDSFNEDQVRLGRMLTGAHIFITI